jgi:hypothetical protein
MSFLIKKVLLCAIKTVGFIVGVGAKVLEAE